MKTQLLASAALLCAALPASAHEGDGGMVTYASDHAPIGVMADHRHKKGEWMTSYRYMYMDMSGNRDGTDSLSPEEIVTTAQNPFANPPMMPPTLRVVPTDMPMQMHMVGGMYGLTDRITLMAMGMYVTKEMDHITFQGPMGTTRLGEFTTETSGFGDTTVGAIIGLDDGSYEHRQINLGIALSLPTGSIEETDQILTPMNTTPTPRLPYPMQLGSGSFDLKPSLTARSRAGKWSYGAQASAVIRLDENDEGYTLGDVGEVTGWLAYEPQPWVSLSGRLKAKSVGQIDGMDPLIMAPVQTADPANHGGETVEALFGINLAGQTGWQKGHRIAAEVGLPVMRDLNGPQMETDLTFTLGWQKAF
ncbi:MAG: transporter [Henriciella sp.]|nr:transporter [Henriciella sp.]